MDGDGRLRRPGGAGCVLALGYVEASPPEGFASWPEWFAHYGVPQEEWDDGAYIEDPVGVQPGISFLKVPEPKAAKNRVHFDVQAGGGRGVPWEVRWPRVTQAVGRLTAAGATVIREDAQAGICSGASKRRRARPWPRAGGSTHRRLNSAVAGPVVRHPQQAMAGAPTAGGEERAVRRVEPPGGVPAGYSANP